jgi:hypothetical protein
MMKDFIRFLFCLLVALTLTVGGLDAYVHGVFGGYGESASVGRSDEWVFDHFLSDVLTTGDADAARQYVSPGALPSTRESMSTWANNAASQVGAVHVFVPWTFTETDGHAVVSGMMNCATVSRPTWCAYAFTGEFWFAGGKIIRWHLDFTPAAPITTLPSAPTATPLATLPRTRRHPSVL